MAKEDVRKTAFRCPGFVGLFEWVLMTFGMKNVGATYQRAMNLIFHNLLGVLMEVYMDDVVVKSVGFEEHTPHLKLLLEKMKKYMMQMTPLKCAFGVTSGKFLGFVVHECGIQIDPKKIESIGKIGEPVCKKDVQKMLRKINYLQRFISNLARRVESLLPLVRLKHEEEFAWGAKQREAFKKIKEYLVSPPVLRSPKAGNPFKMYIAAHERVIGAVFLQEEDGKEFPIAFMSRHILDAETRYVFMEKLCLSLYYACSKFQHYIVSSSCIVACQYDVIKHMLLKPILSGRIGKWAYVLVEYDLAYEPLRSMKGQVVADFVVDHAVEVDNPVSYVHLSPWGLYFDGSICSRRQGAGCVIVSPSGVIIDLSVRLEFACTNKQIEYESLLHGLEYLRDFGERDVDVFGDYNLIVQQIRGDSQCLDGVLNSYQDRCLDNIKFFDTFSIKQIPREENSRANRLAQQASSYVVTQEFFF
jgi:ribonuclease HI